MLSGHDIICFANDWDADPTSKHQVMKVLARSNKVLWVNSIGLRRPGASAQDASRIFKKIRQFCRGPVLVNGNMHVLTPLAFPFHGMPFVKSINRWLVSRYVRRQAKKLGMNGFHLWTFLPTAGPLISQLKPKKVVYYCVDEWSAFTFLDPKLMQDMEEGLIGQSDLVITTATALYESKKHLNKHTYLIPHGVDSEFFGRARLETTPVAPQLAGLSKPVIGFWGLIHEWIDQELLWEAATLRPDWSFVLVGKVGVDCSRLKGVPNIHLLGPHSYESLAGFAKGFTAAILPFKVNRLTNNVNPIKLREYLAAGLPVVSTALPEVQPYADVVRIATTPDAFVRALDAAVQDTSQEAVDKRIASVGQETWQAKVELISSLMDKVSGEKITVSGGQAA